MRENPGSVARGMREGIFESSRKIASRQERQPLSAAATRRAGLSHAVGLAALVTVVATLLAYLLPEDWRATGVGFAFLLTTYWMVIRHDDPVQIRAYGVSLAGLMEPVPLQARRLWRDALTALGWAGLCCILIFPCFWLGFRSWWDVDAFRPAPLWPLASALLAELLVIALPEEAFYRGYLQSSLDRALGKPWRVLGAELGLGLPLASAVFAVGHLLTELHPARLAVFFPSLVFGWLRAKTGGIGASIVFHAACNLFASYLLRSYGLAR